MQLKPSTSTSTIQRCSRPKPKSGFIPPTEMGDILQIWNFFNTFSDLLKCQGVEKEEIYASLTYKGEDSPVLVNDMHQDLLNLFLQEYVQKDKFESLKDRKDYPFFALLKRHIGGKDFDGSILAFYWTEFLRKMVDLPSCGELFSETTMMLFEALGKKTCLEYNTLEYKQKIEILISLIQALYETDYLRDYLQEKIKAIEKIIKEEEELRQEIKQDEKAYKELIAKTQNGTMSEIQEELLRQEEVINRKKAKLQELESESFMPIQTAFYAGSDVHKSEYWVFHSEPTKLYVRYSEIVSTDEEWYHYDTKSELDQLMKSLNPRGANENELLQTLVTLIETGKLTMKNDGIESERNKENIPPVGYSAQQNKDSLIQKKSSKELNLETIKSSLLETEAQLNLYLSKLNYWWAFPQKREEVLNHIMETQDLNEMRYLLLDLHGLWKYRYSYKNKCQSEDETEVQEGDSKGGDSRDSLSTNFSPQKMETEEIEVRKIDKFGLKFWGVFGDESWIKYTRKVDNIAGIYFSAKILCGIINSFVERNTLKIDEYKNRREFLQANNNDKIQIEIEQMTTRLRSGVIKKKVVVLKEVNVNHGTRKSVRIAKAKTSVSANLTQQPVRRSTRHHL